MALLGMLGQHCMLGLGHLKIAKQYSAQVAEESNFATKKTMLSLSFLQSDAFSGTIQLIPDQ